MQNHDDGAFEVLGDEEFTLAFGENVLGCDASDLDDQDCADCD